MTTLTEQLNMIGQDILKHLTESSVALSQNELYQKSDLGVAKKRVGLSSYGWSFALERLEKKHEIEFVAPCHWQLKNPDRKAYLHIISEMSNAEIRPD